VDTPLFDDLSRALGMTLIQVGDFRVTPLFLLKFVVLFVVLALFARFVRRRLVLRLLRNSQIDPGVKYAVARIVAYGVWVLGLLLGLPLVGIQLNSLLVAFGAVGIGIGLGLQKIAENFISGMILLFARPVKVGDRVRLDDVEGTIIEIQGRVTLVRDNNNVVYLVPNATLVSDLVVNLTHNDRIVRYVFEVGVSYSADPNAVKELLLTVAAGHPALLSDPPPDVLFVGFGDSSINFKLRAYSKEMVEIPDTLKSEVNFAIWYALKEAGIEIPFPQRDLHIKSARGLEGVRLPTTVAVPPKPLQVRE
jgi:small-conductance mechanosensitive channel